MLPYITSCSKFKSIRSRFFRNSNNNNTSISGIFRKMYKNSFSIQFHILKFKIQKHRMRYCKKSNIFYLLIKKTIQKEDTKNSIPTLHNTWYKIIHYRFWDITSRNSVCNNTTYNTVHTVYIRQIQSNYSDYRVYWSVTQCLCGVYCE